MAEMRPTALFLILVSMLCAAAPGAPRPEVPRKAADYAIQTAPDKYIWTNQYAGKTVVLAFILTDCSHCQFTTGLLNAIQKDYGERGVQVLESAINPMSALHIPEFTKQFQPAFPVGYNDQKYAAKFLGYPEIVMIDRTGMIRAQFSGDDTRLLKDVQDKTLREALDQTLGAVQAAQKKGQTANRPSAPKQ
jgi:thiol-disulfide isomerase/thioredoxin